MAKGATPLLESAETGNDASPPSSKQPKLAVFLVSVDDGLWPQLSAQLGADMTARQFDALDELIAGTTAGQSAVVVWDARGDADPGAVLTRLHAHSPRFAIVALEDAGAASAAAWVSRQQQQQVVAVVGLPLESQDWATALAAAREEAGVRIALLGENPMATFAANSRGAVGERRARPRPAGRDRPGWLPFAAGGIAFAALASATAFFLLRSHGDANELPRSRGVGAGLVAPTGAATDGSDLPVADDRVFALIDKARQAMAIRHFIDPMEGSALSLYREALVLDPTNGEARQGSQRIEEILVSRVQSALDDRRFDVALQSLETARSIDPDDGRLRALDARLAGLRAEIGPAQIQAAITAQNFDRASQLIEDAARSKMLSAAKLAQLRDDVRRHQADQEAARFATLIDARLQQDHLIDPARDSALFYLTQARSAGLTAMSAQWQEFYRRGVLATRVAIDQHRFSDADRWVGELRGSGLAAGLLAALQRDLAAARAALPSVQNKPVGSPFVDLARARLASGNLVEPESDSALHYVNQLRTTDPQNAALSQLESLTQTQILERARAALDLGQVSRAEALLQQAESLGPSPEGAALDARLQSAKAAVAVAVTVHDPAPVAEGSLTRRNALMLDYPAEARRKELEGWVEVGFTVSADGKVTQAHVLNANPAGVFDSAALAAISRMRYQAPTVDGRAATVNTALRLVFRLEK